MSTSRQPDQGPAEDGGAAARPLRAIFPLDPLLLLAALGLVACSLVTLSAATRDDIPGDPHYYVDRQASTRRRARPVR